MVVTWDAVNKGNAVTLSNDNLTAVVPNNLNTVRASVGRTSGKWYMEIEFTSLNNAFVGIINEDTPLNQINYSLSNIGYYYFSGNKYPGNTAYGSSYTTNDIISILMDLDNGTLEFWKNGVTQGVAFNNIKSYGTIYPAITSGASGVGSTSTARFRINEFTYQPPEGYLAYDGSKGVINKVLLSSNEKIYTIEYINTKYQLNMTSDTTPSPYKTSSSSQYNSSYQPWKAFDGNSTDSTRAWLTSTNVRTGWIQLDFGDNKKVNTLDISPRSTTLTASPKDFEVLGSYDGVNFDLLAKFENQTQWLLNETRNFTFDNEIDYRYYRINILTNDGYSNYSAIGEITFGYESVLFLEIPSHLEQNFIKYGTASPVQVDGIFTNKNYILQDTVSENTEGLWTTQLNRKPLSIKFN